jgi:hypothetical protein
MIYSRPRFESSVASLAAASRRPIEDSLMNRFLLTEEEFVLTEEERLVGRVHYRAGHPYGITDHAKIATTSF